MTPPGPALDEVLERLEKAIGRLSDESAPLDRLVADYEQAAQLLEAAQALLEAAQERIAAAP